MNSLEEKCKQKGVRLTDQRKVIAQVMSESKDHPDVDELHKRVSGVDKKISIVTVYRTVKLFEEAGILKTRLQRWKSKIRTITRRTSRSPHRH